MADSFTPTTGTGECPKCHAQVPRKLWNCMDCGARLPWADEDIVIPPAPIWGKCPKCDKGVPFGESQCKKCGTRVLPPSSQDTSQIQSKPNPAATGRVNNFCPQCGATHGSNAKFCASCGHNLQVGSATSSTWLPPASQPVVTAPVVMPKQQSSNSASGVWGCVALAFFLIVLPIGCSMLTDSNNTDSTTSTYVSPSDREAERKAGYEEVVKSGLNSKLSEKGVDFTCTEVNLVKETDYKYTGFAKLSDDSTVNVEVKIDPEDGSVIWQTGN